MSFMRSTILVAAGVVVGGALLLAHRVSYETGKSLTESFGAVPEEAQKLFGELRVRADEAIARGREAYQEKQAEMEDQMQDASRS
jgi:hypothetical protein